MPAAAAFTIIKQPALLTDFSEAAAPAPDGVTVWGGRMADGTLNRFGAESAGGIEAEVDWKPTRFLPPPQLGRSGGSALGRLEVTAIAAAESFVDSPPTVVHFSIS
jgi:hypothetical protein